MPTTPDTPDTPDSQDDRPPVNGEPGNAGRPKPSSRKPADPTAASQQIARVAAAVAASQRGPASEDPSQAAHVADVLEAPAKALAASVDGRPRPDDHDGARPRHVAAEGEFGLQVGELLVPGLRRVVLEQVDGAIGLLAPTAKGLTEHAVHESRKALKRLRALTRLMRDELGPARFATENDALRDAGRRLAAARDAEVLGSTLQDIMDRNERRLRHDTFATLAAHLRGERRLADAHLLGDAGAARAVRRELRGVRDRAPSWLAEDARIDAVTPGLERIYGQGMRRYRRARRDPSVEHLHDWRKRVKDLRHVAETLEPAHPHHMSRVARRADRIGETLGDDHDLAMLEQVTHDHPELFASPEERKLLRRLVARRRARLQARAMRLGKRLYKHSPRAFAARVAHDWERHAAPPGTAPQSGAHA